MNNLMANVTDFIKKRPVVFGLILFVVGLLLGWMLLGWQLFPVQYINGDVYQLRDDLKQDYVRLVASAYALDGNVDLAAQRIIRLGADASQQLTSAANSSAGQDAVRIAQLQLVLDASGALVAAVPAAAPAGNPFLVPLLLCGALVVVAGMAGFLYVRMGGSPALRRTQKPKPSAARPAEMGESGLAAEAAPTPTGEPPVARFMSTYTLGDDNYDDSFSVDGPDGSFLGECGMGISETIGVGDPKKVTAFEVWLFDKNDIRTVTKVMMSEHAFRDESLKSRLAAKGEPVLVKAGDMVSLDTATLVVTARVVDMAYGGGPLPPNSYFERLTIELAAFKKPA